MSAVPEWIQVLAVPLLGILGRLAWPTLARRTRRHLELLKETPEHLQQPLAELVTYELTVLRDREMGKADRRIVWSTLVAVVFVVAVGAAAFWLLWQPDNVVINAVAVAVGVFVVMLAIAGASQVWESPAAEAARRERSAAKKAAKQQRRQGRG
ncbi:hypothetical protein [Blastococcus sp. TF02-8]|uniref:hypothetical protein n=1 Tax=Blastococcus sp. TF02-8 TaxID=2250574 RepID=UPI0011BDF004|nr:hypothetical protein [Blastococcus sp. TF02-8]